MIAVCERPSAAAPGGIQILDTATWTSKYGLLTNSDGHFWGAMTFAENGNLMAYHEEDLSVHVWDTVTGYKISTLPMTEPHVAMAVSQSGLRVATLCSSCSDVHLWELYSSSSLSAFKWSHHYKRPLMVDTDGHPAFSGSRNIAFSPTGDLLAVGYDDGVVVLCHTMNFQIFRIFNPHSLPVDSIAFSQDGKMFACASGTRISVTLTDTGETVGEPLVGHTDDILSIAFSPDGRKVISGSNNGTIRVWEYK